MDMDIDFQGIYLAVIRGFKDRHENKEVLNKKTDLQVNSAINNAKLSTSDLIILTQFII